MLGYTTLVDDDQGEPCAAGVEIVGLGLRGDPPPANPAWKFRDEISAAMKSPTPPLNTLPSFLSVEGIRQFSTNIKLLIQ